MEVVLQHKEVLALKYGDGPAERILVAEVLHLAFLGGERRIDQIARHGYEQLYVIRGGRRLKV